MTNWGDLYVIKEESVNWTSDRIQAFAEFKMPDGNWISYSLGIFLMSTPVKKEEGVNVLRDVEAYDKLLILKEDKLTERLTFREGMKYYNCMTSIFEGIGTDKFNIENDGKSISTAKEYEPGTEKLSVLNDLASDLNFTPFWVDEYGYFRSGKYLPPADRSVDYEYKEDELSVTLVGMEEEMDLYNLPNVFQVTVSNPDNETALSATAINNNPNHPRSVQSLGRRIVMFEEKDDIADQEALQSYVERIAYETSQIFGKVTFSTAFIPIHSYSNTIRVQNKTLGIDDKYFETDWSVQLTPGAEMTHSARKTIKLI